MDQPSSARDLAVPRWRVSTPYFAYGSNMLFRRLAQRCPSAEKISIGSSYGFRLQFDKRSWVDGSGKCRIERTGSPTDWVLGVLYGIEEEDLVSLDGAEGLGNGYEAGPISVEVAGGTTVVAFTYLADQQFLDAELMPFNWYVDLVVAGARENELPPEYVRQLETVSSLADPEADRAAEMRGILETRLPSESEL